MKDAQTKSRNWGSVCGMGQSKLKKDAVMKDAPTKLREKESVGGMERRRE